MHHLCSDHGHSFNHCPFPVQFWVRWERAMRLLPLRRRLVEKKGLRDVRGETRSPPSLGDMRNIMVGVQTVPRILCYTLALPLEVHLQLRP